jgi:hypothetical protein
MSTLLIYFILTAVPSCTGCGRWEFYSMERVNDIEGGASTCKAIARGVARAFDGKPGSKLAICVEDQEVGT